MSFYYHVDAFYTGSGLKLVENTKDERLLKISPDYASKKAIDPADKLGNRFTKNDCFCPESYGYLPNGDEEIIFAEGRGLFTLNLVHIADNIDRSGLNNVDRNYGIVPTPLYDESQKDYITVIGNPFALYGVMATAPDPVMSTAALECRASEAYRRTSPEIFEINMKYKYTREDISAKMFDILRRTSVTDLGRIYGSALDPLMSEMPSKTACRGNSWTTPSKAYTKPPETQLRSLTKESRKGD